MKTRNRQDSIFRRLRHSGTAPEAALADDGDVSRRTIMRDIRALHEEGYIINTDPGPGAAFYLIPCRSRPRPASQ